VHLHKGLEGYIKIESAWREVLGEAGLVEKVTLQSHVRCDIWRYHWIDPEVYGFISCESD
jgi:hypothetical protein